MKSGHIIWSIAAMVLGISAPLSDAYAGEAKSAQQTVKALFEAFNRHDAAGMAALYAEDSSLLTSEYCGPLRGRRAVEQTYAMMFEQVPDIRDDVTDLFVNGDKVAVRFISSSKLPGREFQMVLANFFEVKDGLIISDQTIYNVEKPCQPAPKE